MAAIIRTYLNGDLSTMIEGASRDDLRPGDVVHCESIGGLLTGEGHRWTLAYAPDALDGSASEAALSSELDQHSTFEVDNEGAYLLRLVTDPHTPHESVQFVRLRVLTKFGSLKMVAAGERRDGGGIIPVDVSTEGWANDQNYNLQELLHHISRTSISSRVLFVDSNRGYDYTNAQNTEIAEGYGDFFKVQDAIDFAVNADADNSWLIYIRPGRYVESLTIPKNIHLVGEPSGGGHPPASIETLGLKNHVADIAVNATSSVTGILLTNTDNLVESTLTVQGGGRLVLNKATIEQHAAGAASGVALQVSDSTVLVHDSQISNANTTNEDRFAIHLANNSSVQLVDSAVRGESGVLGEGNNTFSARHSTITSSANHADSNAIRSEGRVFVSGGGVSSDNHSYTAISMTGGGNILGLELVNTFVSGKLHFDKNTAPIFGATLSSVAIRSEDITFLPSEEDCGVTHGTAGESLSYWADKTAHSSSLKAGSIPADSVQQALDQILDLSLSVVSLNDAYNGVIDHTKEPFVRGDGQGNRIVADAVDGLGKGIPVQITDSDAPGAFAAQGESKGRLQVVSNVEVGAVNAPEIDLDPNPFAIGPKISMGQTVWNTLHKPAATLQANSLDGIGRHYNLLLQTQAAGGGADIGSVFVQGGQNLDNAAQGGSVHISAGSGSQGGDISLWPGVGTGDNGKLVLRGSTADASATLIASNAFAGGVAGTLVLGVSDYGVFSIEVTAADTLADLATKISAVSAGLSAVDDGGHLSISYTQHSLAADVFVVSTSSSELNVALGDLSESGATFTGPTQASYEFSIRLDNHREISLGVDGAAGPMTYSSETGALSVPGAIAAASLETTGDLVVGGDLTVLGDSTIAYTNTVKVEDKNLELGTIEGGGETDATADGGGITIKGNTDKTFIWDQATNAFSVNTNFTVPSGKIGVGLDGMATPEPQKTLYVHTENDGDGFLVENSHDGSKFLVDYSAGNGTNAQLFDDSNTRTVFFRSYGNSWFNAGNVGIGTESPSKLFHVETDADGEGVFVGNTSNGSKFLVDYSMGNGINTQLFDETNTRTIFFRSYGNSWFVNTVSIGTDTPVADKALTVEGDVAIDGDLDVTGTITASGIVAPVVQTHTIVSDIDYDATAGDYFIICDTDAAGGDIYVWIDPAIEAGQVLVIKNKGDTHEVSIATGSIAGGFSADSLIDDVAVCSLPPKEAVSLVCNGGEDWSIF